MAGSPGWQTPDRGDGLGSCGCSGDSQTPGWPARKQRTTDAAPARTSSRCRARPTVCAAGGRTYRRLQGRQGQQLAEVSSRVDDTADACASVDGPAITSSVSIESGIPPRPPAISISFNTGLLYAGCATNELICLAHASSDGFFISNSAIFFDSSRKGARSTICGPTLILNVSLRTYLSRASRLAAMFSCGSSVRELPAAAEAATTAEVLSPIISPD